MSKDNWRNAGRKTKFYYYKDSIIKNGKIVMPEIITEDYGYEMQFGIKQIHVSKENTYIQQKKNRVRHDM